MVTAPVPAETSGRNNLSNSAPPDFTEPANPVKISAAATGVPNKAPTVPATVSETVSRPGTRANARPIRTVNKAILMALAGFSGPRLTPPANPRTAAAASPGTTAAAGTLSANSDAAESGPACPGAYRAMTPTAKPVSVSVPKIHQGPSPSAPTVCGSRSQISPCR